MPPLNDIEPQQFIQDYLSCEPELRQLRIAAQNDPHILAKYLQICLANRPWEQGERMIPAVPKAMIKAFKLHWQLGKNGETCSHRLLLFYAAECGLKAVYMQQRNIPSTDQIRDTRLKKSHKLEDWVKELSIRASSVPEWRNFTLKTKSKKAPQESFSSNKVHEAWRYGIPIKDEDDEFLKDWLMKIIQWVERVENR